ncbi:DDB1- and CUL4-associated factor 12 [Mortierella sp. 14UC]|nr:DDB1- and CUL4-associated factor 12 [Mortierella sp. 14UC]
MAPRPTSPLSTSRTWVASVPSSSSSSIIYADEKNGYLNVQQSSPVSPQLFGYIQINKLTEYVSSRVPTIISEREFDVEGYDKVFAATWLNAEEVLMGTKCNKLVVLNVRTNKRVHLGRIEESLEENSTSVLSRLGGMTTEQEGDLFSRSLGKKSVKVTSSPTNGGSGIANSLERGLRFLNSGRRSSTPSFTSSTHNQLVRMAISGSRNYPGAADYTVPATVPTFSQATTANPNNATVNTNPNTNLNTSTNTDANFHAGMMHGMAAASTSAGIRSLSINPSRTLLAVGAGEPFQVTIYSIPEYEPVGIMYGHADLVFSLTWVTDTVLVSGSRDGSMRVWSMDSPVMTTLPSVTVPIEVRFPVLSRGEEKTKVRDLSLNKGTGISKLKLVRSTETVCLTSNADANLFAVGSQSHITVIDPRTSGLVHEIESCDEGWGVRALDFKSHIITTGGGFGRLGYYDLRAQRYLDGFDNDQSTRPYQDIGSGWLNRDTAYAGSISDIAIRNAHQIDLAMDWDSSREYDSQTFSEDYNLHGASGRSMDHPSVTQDDNHFIYALGHHRRRGDNEDLDDYDGDEGSIENADLDLIADIVDGKPPRHNTYQRRGLVRRATPHQTDENSVSSLMRYVMEGSQDPLDLEESPAFDPTRLHTGSHQHHQDQQGLFGDEVNDDHVRDWSGSTPKRQTRTTTENIKIPKASPFAKRSLLPTRQTAEHTPRPVRHVRGMSIDDGSKLITQLPIASIPMRARPGSGAGQKTPPVTFAATVTTNPLRRSHPEHSTPHKQLKPIFRSAMKPPSGSLGANNQGPRKPVRHIQLPTDLSDEDDEDEEVDRDDIEKGSSSQPPPPIVATNKSQGPIEPTTESDDEVTSPTKSAGEIVGIAAVPVPVPASVPGPTRFTRVSKANVSPGKKPIATIPTPQDAPQDGEGNEEVQKSVKEMKTLLRRLGLMPLSTTLDAGLEDLDTATVKKGGLCEMMSLVQKLGAMCEKQTEVIHQMTDQIIAGETRTQLPPQVVVDPEAEEKVKALSKQLEDVQNELEESKKAKWELELEVDYLRQTADEEYNSSQGKSPPTRHNLVDASSQVSGSWATADSALGAKNRIKDRKADSPLKPATRSTSNSDPSAPTSAAWRQHIKMIEHELQALKTVLDRSPSATVMKDKAESLQQLEDLEDRLYDALLENRRLQVKNKNLARELLNTNIDFADGHLYEALLTKHETTMVKDMMLRLGVEQPQQVMSALDQIEHILKDVPRQRRFIAKAEKIIWESEIQEGTVRVQHQAQSGHDDLEKGAKKGQLEQEDGNLTIKPGRTCSQSYEVTLQRLKEWSELLDVLNHVEFADDFDDNATVLA